MRLFLDANILCSAAYREGSPALLLFELAAAGRCCLVTSRFAWDEAQRNIALKRADRLPSLDLLNGALEHAPLPDDLAIADAAARGLPDKDLPILAAALVARADVLVTGDRGHFGLLYGRDIGRLRVLTLRESLAWISASCSGGSAALAPPTERPFAVRNEILSQSLRHRVGACAGVRVCRG